MSTRKLNSLAAYKTYADKYYFIPELTKAILIRNGAFANENTLRVLTFLELLENLPTKKKNL